MREPEALNTLASERAELKIRVRELLPEKLPLEIESAFGDWSEYFTDQVIHQWREDKRFDEIIDYLIYQYDEFDGHKPWGQVLLDLRLNNEKSKAVQLLEGLLMKREKMLISTLSKLKKDPENLNLQVALTIRKASVLSLLAEIEFVIHVKPVEDSYKEQHEKLKRRIKKVQEYGQ